MGDAPVRPALDLYRTLMEKNLTTGYERSQERFHDPRWASQWLGPDLAAPYLEGCPSFRWPQEGLTAEDIAQALAGASNRPQAAQNEAF